MDRKTLLAVVISVVIIVGGMLLQSVLFPPKVAPTPTAAPQATTTTGPQVTTSGPEQPSGQQVQQPTGTNTQPAQTPVTAPGGIVATADSAPPPNQAATVQRETDFYDLTFSTAGGTLSSVKLRKYKNDDGSLVDMLLLPAADTPVELPFGISFGDYTAAQIAVPFNLRETSDGVSSTFDFYRTFSSTTGVPFTLHKTYLFYRDDYLFQLQITIENSVNDVPVLGTGGYAYTLSLGPQIGPKYAKLDGRNDYRNYAYYENGKRQDPRVGMGSIKELDKLMGWTAIVGKYFTALAVPDANPYRTVYDSRRLVQGFDRSNISFERPQIKSAKSTDTFRFYMGPLKSDILARYNDPANNPRFGLSGLHADTVVTYSPLIGWLAQLLKYLLDFFVLIIPNYGIAIILLTLLIKVIFLPLTFKSSEATARMATLNPKITEIRTRLKEKPEKMNQEIAELYKREKVNPLSGCLPLLLQIPVFFALYNLLNSHFELRGALFIPGWIPDLSMPESVLNFPFTIPLVGWTALRALPLVMVATQILQGKFTQPAGGAPQTGAQMKLLTYALPVVFLFILYDMPSGLVLYWTVQNILSIFQQLYINALRKKKDAVTAAAVRPTGKQGLKSSR